ncbi:MAG: DNA/RNA non-specific endonuclease [Flavobacteriaceae bacterium]|nr:DNA/RNA non-specific endonuclease [Flavobacteriaceae bacterium]
MSDSAFDKTGKLKPNVKYKTGEFGYHGETDELGRLSRSHTDDLKISTKDRLPHKAKTPGKLKGDHAGHIFGDRFGGSADLDNIVSQLSSVNLSKFKKIENQWAKALKEVPPKSVKVDVKVNYKGNDVRPSSFEVLWKINGEPKRLKISNIK